MDGIRYEFFGTASPADDLKARAGRTITLGMERDGVPRDVTVTLRSPGRRDGEAAGAGHRDAGCVSRLQEYTGRPLPEAVGIGVAETGRWFGLIIDGLKGLVTSIATDPTAAPPVSGPVGIATSLGDVFRGSGPVMTLYVAGILSANLALVNVLPFPPLDGGRMLVILLKAIPRYGRRISLRAEQVTYAVGFLALFAFLIWITVFDIVRQVGGGTP